MIYIFPKATKKILNIEDYSSNTVKQLNIKETKKILLSLDYFNNKKKIIVDN